MAPSDVDREILRILLSELVAPAMAALPPMDEHVAVLRKEVAQLLRDHGATVDTVARHLGMSVRWVRSVTNTQPAETAGHSWFSAILGVMASRYPEALDVDETCQELKRRGRGLSPHATATLLDLYWRLGHLERVEARYRAHSSVIVEVGSEHTERVEKLRARAAHLWPISRSFARGDPGSAFGLFRGEVDPETLEEMSAELVAAVQEIVRRHVEAAERKPGSDRTKFVNFNGILAVGHGSGSDQEEDP